MQIELLPCKMTVMTITSCDAVVGPLGPDTGHAWQPQLRAAEGELTKHTDAAVYISVERGGAGGIGHGNAPSALKWRGFFLGVGLFGVMTRLDIVNHAGESGVMLLTVVNLIGGSVSS